MTLAEIIDVVRRQLDDMEGGAARLFSDSELAYFANDAQDRIVKANLPIEDSTTEADANGVPVCVIPVRSGVKTYLLHPKIQQIMRVRYDGVDYPLCQFSTERLDVQRPGWEDDTGIPDGYILDQDTWSLRLNKIPEEASNLRLIVKRLPLNVLSPNNLTASPEIPLIYHDYMPNWMLHMAFMKQDVETYNQGKADLYFSKFMTDIEQAKRMHIRRKQRSIRFVGSL